MTPDASVRPVRLVAVLDTNAIHPGNEASDAFSICVDRLVDLARNLPFKLELFICAATAEERQQQLIQKARKVRGNLDIGCRFFDVEVSPFTNDPEAFVRSKFQSRCEHAGIQIAGLSYGEVAWDKLTAASLSRQPPFAIDGEKGFRDALIVESIDQLIRSLPGDPRDCQVVVVSQDKRFIEAIEMRFSNSANVSHVDTRERLVEWVQVLCDGLSADDLEEILRQADDLFVNETWTAGLWVQAGLESRIRAQFRDDFQCEAPDGVSIRHKDVVLSVPLFDGLSADRVHLKNTVEFQFDFVVPREIANVGESSLASMLVGDRLSRGAMTFEISWSAQQAKDGSLSEPELKGIVAVHRKRFPPEYEFERAPQLLGLDSPDGRRRLASRCKHPNRFEMARPRWMEPDSGEQSAQNDAEGRAPQS